MRALLLLLTTVLLAGCLPASAPIAAPRSEPAFRPEAFFAGSTHGDPVLKIRARPTQQLHVESYGEVQPDGTFRLDQTVTYPDGRTEERTWSMRALGQGRYTATLTPDATGPVEATADGNTFHIRYPMRGGLHMEQHIALRKGGQVADNVATVRMMGIPIARLTETITRDE